MDTVIMAAGKGERLGPREDTLPKLFVEVGNKTIFEHQLEALSPLRPTVIDPVVTVVLGYGFVDSPDAEHKLSEYVYIDQRFEYNIVYLENWNVVENSKSALAGVESVDGDDHVLLLCGDIVVSPGQLEEFIQTFYEECSDSTFSAVAAFEGCQNEMTAIRWDKNDVVTDYGAIEGHQEAGMFILHREHVQTTKDRWERSSGGDWFPVVFPEVPSKAIRLDPGEHIEINTQEHLTEGEEILPFEGKNTSHTR